MSGAIIGTYLVLLLFNHESHTEAIDFYSAKYDSAAHAWRY
jgi:hypothetical protein